MKNKNIRFMLLSALYLTALIIGYFLLVDQLLIPSRKIPESYRYFMLTASRDIPQRIIIDSGSNAIHGIDVALIEKATGYATFNIADNGGYPLRHKIYRLHGNLNTGDIVIFPIEWLQYSYATSLPDQYVNSLIGKNSPNAFYYHQLPLKEKLSFVFTDLPYQTVVNETRTMTGHFSRHHRIDNNQLDRLAMIKRRLAESYRGSERQTESVPFERLTKGMRCDAYLFGIYRDRMMISDTFRDNLALLKELEQETGAQILFTWPAVAAKDELACYASVTKKLVSHTEQIRQAVNSYGFTFLGETSDSVFPKDCILDSYYHIKHHCAIERTERLISQLNETGISTQQRVNPQHITEILMEKWNQLYDTHQALH